jgi:cytochrome c oxidase subunit 2
VRLRTAGATLASAILLSGCSSLSTAEPVTREAKDIHSLYVIVTVMALLIWAGVTGVIVYSVVKFRKRPGDEELPPQTHGSTTAEIIWTIIPTIIVLILFGMSYSTLRSVDKIRNDDEVAAIVHVRGYQWFWEFDYGDGRVSKAKPGKQPIMYVPVGETVRIVQTTDNVIHAWFVPKFLFKKDDVPGRPNSFEFRVDLPGRYKGQCAELCGSGHANMTFEVHAVSRKVFEEEIGKLVGGCEGDEKVDPVQKLSSPAGQAVFDKECLVAAADKPFTIQYSNGGGLPHNVAVTTKAPGEPPDIFDPKLKTISKGSTKYEIEPLKAGDYTFFCQVHPGMKGQLQVKEGS